jgi:hypothetical protein
MRLSIPLSIFAALPFAIAAGARPSLSPLSAAIIMKSAAMRRALSLSSLGSVFFAACVLAATPDQAPSVAPGQARVWFLRQLSPGTSMDAPMIYANGTPITVSQQGTVFYRDFDPGTYIFSVQNCLQTPGTDQTLTLGAGNEFALEVQSGDIGPTDCTPSQISYLRPPSGDMLGELFRPLIYLGPK